MLTFIANVYMLIFLVLSTTTTHDESSTYRPTDYILISCGSSSSTSMSENGRKWIGDKFMTLDSDNNSFVSTASTQDPSVTQVPFMTSRAAFHGNFTCSFPVSPGLKFVRFFFYPVQYSAFDGTTSFFSVTANNHFLLRNFSAYLTISAILGRPGQLIKEFMVPCFETEKLNITFSPSPNSLAFVNGIEVVSIPKGMYVNHPENSLSLVNTKVPFDHIPDATAFETVYRLNVGGGTVENVDDTGLFRRWRYDQPYFFGSVTETATPRGNAVIKFSRVTPAYTAPATVYTTFRSMSSNPKINMKNNLTWNFPIDTGFNYLLRLHFCETQLEITEAGQRVFDIFINNQTAELHADVIRWSGGNGYAVYRDYVLFIPSDSQSNQILWLALHPSPDVDSKFPDAFLNGLEIFRLNKSDGSLAVPNPVPPRSEHVKPKKGKRIVMIVVALAFTAAVSLSLLLSLIFWRNKCLSYYKRKAMEGRKSSPFPDQLCQCFTLEEIIEATNNFDDTFVIGHGGFGNVYKGFIKGIKCEVAIKRLDSMSQQGASEFWTEIKLLSQLRHIHLLSLIGYCDDGNEMIIVYEYMANGTLRDHLYNTEKEPLSWEQRLEICIGAARGLDHLHSGAVDRIIHRDVKSTNILLDENYVAKVSDFGLSKISPISRTNVPLTTVVKGTFGYMDPEYYRRQQLTEKSDVYALGVVLFEVLFARPAVDSNLEYSQISLADWARKSLENKSIDEAIDPFLKGQVSSNCLRTYASIAENCIRENGFERPSMNDVAQRLEFALQLQQIDGAEEISQASGAQSQVDEFFLFLK